MTPIPCPICHEPAPAEPCPRCGHRDDAARSDPPPQPEPARRDLTGSWLSILFVIGESLA